MANPIIPILALFLSLGQPHYAPSVLTYNDAKRPLPIIYKKDNISAYHHPDGWDVNIDGGNVKSDFTLRDGRIQSAIYTIGDSTTVQHFFDYDSSGSVTGITQIVFRGDEVVARTLENGDQEQLAYNIYNDFFNQLGNPLKNNRNTK